MRINLGAKPLTYPQPVYIIGTYDEAGIPDAMNAARGGITGNAEITFCVGRTRKTIENLKKTGAFTVSIATEEFLKACDYVGLVSGNDQENKFEIAGFHHTKGENVNAPIIEELPMTLECQVKEYDERRERLIGRIINVSIDDSVMVGDKVDVKKLNPIIYDPVNMAYWGFGEKKGNAFSDGKELIK